MEGELALTIEEKRAEVERLIKEKFPNASTTYPTWLRLKIAILEMLHPLGVHTRTRLMSVEDGELIDLGFGCRICHIPLP